MHCLAHCKPKLAGQLHRVSCTEAWRRPADVAKAMDYLFMGVLPPHLPPTPTVELRQSDGQKKGKMMAREVQMQTIKPPKCLPHIYRPSLQAQRLHCSPQDASMAGAIAVHQATQLDLEPSF